MAAHPGLDSHSSIWTDVKCGDLVKGQKVVIVDSETTVEAAAEVLVKNGISSAPIYHRATNSYLGMFDYSDLVSYILVVYNKKAWKEDEEDVEIKEIVRRATTSQPVQVKYVSDLSRKNPFYSTTAESTLLQAMDVFSKGIHRLAIVGQDGNLVGVLTQSNVANFLYPKLINSPIGHKSLLELGLGKSKVVSIHSEAQVFAAMTLMHDQGLSSVPLIDRGGYLVGSISLSDIKYVLKGFKYNMLWRSCFQFISYVRSSQGLEDQGRDRFPFFDVHETDNLLKAIGKIGATKSHRVWVVDQANKPVGVVSLSDCLRALLPKE